MSFFGILNKKPLDLRTSLFGPSQQKTQTLGWIFDRCCPDKTSGGVAHHVMRAQFGGKIQREKSLKPPTPKWNYHSIVNFSGISGLVLFFFCENWWVLKVIQHVWQKFAATLHPMALSNRPFGGAIFLRLSSKWPFDLIGLSNDGESGKSESSCFAGWFLFGQNLNWGAIYISKSVRIQPRIDVDLYHKYWVVWLSKVQLLFVKFTFDLEWNWNIHWHISLPNWTDRRLYIQDEMCFCQNICRPISCQIFFWLLFWLTRNGWRFVKESRQSVKKALRHGLTLEI